MLDGHPHYGLSWQHVLGNSLASKTLFCSEDLDMGFIKVRNLHLMINSPGSVQDRVRHNSGFLGSFSSPKVGHGSRLVSVHVGGADLVTISWSSAPGPLHPDPLRRVQHGHLGKVRRHV